MTPPDGGRVRPNAYISGPLQAARDLGQARVFYEQLAEVCDESGCEAYLPHQRTDPVRQAHASAREVFGHDLTAIYSADLIVAYVGAPSSGVGSELGIAYERSIPVIGLCGPEGVASRFVEGLLKCAPEAQLLRYRDEEECRRLLRATLREFVAHGWRRSA